MKAKFRLTKEEKEFKIKVLKKTLTCPLCNKKGLLFVKEYKDVSYFHCVECRHSFAIDKKNYKIEDLGREKVYKRNNLFFKLLYALNKK